MEVETRDPLPSFGIWYAWLWLWRLYYFILTFLLLLSFDCINWTTVEYFPCVIVSASFSFEFFIFWRTLGSFKIGNEYAMKNELVLASGSDAAMLAFFILYLPSTTCEQFLSEKKTCSLCDWLRSVVTNVFAESRFRTWNGCRCCETSKIMKRMWYVERGKSNLFRWKETNGQRSHSNRRKTCAEIESRMELWRYSVIALKRVWIGIFFWFRSSTRTFQFQSNWLNQFLEKKYSTIATNIPFWYISNIRLIEYKT